MDTEVIHKYTEKMTVAENILRLRVEKKEVKPVFKITTKTSTKEKIQLEIGKLLLDIEEARQTYKKFLAVSDKKNAIKSLKRLNKLTDTQIEMSKLLG